MKFNLIFSNVVNGREELEPEIVITFTSVLGEPILDKKYYTKEESHYNYSDEKESITLSMVDNIYQFEVDESDVQFILSMKNLLDNLDYNLDYELEG